jgi:hypothetical protein
VATARTPMKFPGLPETLLSGIGTLGLEGSPLGLMLLAGLPGSVVLVGREPVEALLDAARVVLSRQRSETTPPAPLLWWRKWLRANRSSRS